MKRLLVLVTMLSLFAFAFPSPATAKDLPRNVTHNFNSVGHARYSLEGGYVVEFSATRAASGKAGLAKPLSDLSNNVTVGIDMYDAFGVLLWRFSETVIWAWNGSAVTSSNASSSANTYTIGWYVASQPSPSTYWIINPIRMGNTAQSTLSCCFFIPYQTNTPTVTIQVDALGGWSGSTSCC